MRLRVILPTQIALDEEVEIVNAQGRNGAFGLLPHHVDFVSVLVPGLIGYRHEGREFFVGVDGGLLVKRDSMVYVATPRATHGTNLGDVRRLIRETFTKRDEQEERALRALRKLEADMVRRIVEQGREYER